MDFERTRRKKCIKRFPEKNPPIKKRVEPKEQPLKVQERVKERRNARIRHHLCVTCLPSNERYLLALFYGDECFYCFGDFEDVDHFIPISKGGLHCWSNIVPCCKSCNQSKADKMPEEWDGWDGNIPDTLAHERGYLAA